jgi:hypothetical protein
MASRGAPGKAAKRKSERDLEAKTTVLPATEDGVTTTAPAEGSVLRKQQMSNRRRKNERKAHLVAAAPAAGSGATPLALASRKRPTPTPSRRTTAGGGPVGQPGKKGKREEGETTSGCCWRTPGHAN